MSNVPTDLKYAKSHEWVRVSGDTATIGITDHAQHELTDVVFVELPPVNRQVKAGESCARTQVALETAIRVTPQATAKFANDAMCSHCLKGSRNHSAKPRRRGNF